MIYAHEVQEQLVDLVISNDVGETISLFWIDSSMSPPQLVPIIEEFFYQISERVDSLPGHQFVVQLNSDPSIGVQFTKGTSHENLVIRYYEDFGMTVSHVGSSTEFSTNRGTFNGCPSHCHCHSNWLFVFQSQAQYGSLCPIPAPPTAGNTPSESRTRCTYHTTYTI